MDIPHLKGDVIATKRALALSCMLNTIHNLNGQSFFESSPWVFAEAF